MSTHRANIRAVIVSDRSFRANVITSISPDLDEAFAALCSERKMTRAALLRELIERAVIEEAQKNPPSLAARGVRSLREETPPVAKGRPASS